MALTLLRGKGHIPHHGLSISGSGSWITTILGLSQRCFLPLWQSAKSTASPPLTSASYLRACIVHACLATGITLPLSAYLCY